MSFGCVIWSNFLAFTSSSIIRFLGFLQTNSVSMRFFPNNNPKRGRSLGIKYHISTRFTKMPSSEVSQTRVTSRRSSPRQKRSANSPLSYRKNKTKPKEMWLHRNFNSAKPRSACLQTNPPVHVFKFQESKNWCQWITKGWMGIILVFRASHVNPDSDIHCPPKTWQ